MISNKKVMAQNILYYMNDRNVTAAEICKALKIKQNTFSDWVNAKSYPRIDKIEMLANYFNISKADLVEVRLPDAKEVIVRIDHAIDMLNACEDDRDAEFFTKISKDRTFMKYIGVLYSLKDEFKEQVYDYIEYTLNKEKNGESKTSELYEEG